MVKPILPFDCRGFCVEEEIDVKCPLSIEAPAGNMAVRMKDVY